MKKRTKVVLIIIASVVLLGTVFGVVDYNRVKNNKKPLFMINLRNRQDPYNYIGLGYRMQRFTGLSPKQPLSSDSWVKFGTWFYIKEIEIKSKLDNNEQENIESRQSENSISCNIDDFEMNFYIDKKEYKTTDKIKAWATFKYVGNNDSIKIFHASSYMIFTITDGKDFNVNGAVNMILKSSTLDKGKLYYFDFQKSGGWEADGPDADFWEKFYNEKDLLLPKGEYTIAAKASFSLAADSQDKNLICELKIEVEE